MKGWKTRAEFIKRKLAKIKTWQMVTALVILIILSGIALRANNVRMIELRDAVVAADESGDAAELQQAASELQSYVSRHMNTDTGKIPLQNSYNTAVQAAFKQVNTVDSSGYAAATENCKAVLHASGYQSYAACIAGAVGVNESSLKKPDLPNPALYYLSYASPLVSFDVAGVLTVVTIVVFFAIILKLLTETILSVVLYRKS